MSRYNEMSDSKLTKMLYEYSRTRKGDISDLTYAASVRIEALSASVRKYREEAKKTEDDGK